MTQASAENNRLSINIFVKLCWLLLEIF